MTEDGIRDALRACFDPEVPLDLVELGCVLRVELTADPDAPGAGIPGVPPRFRLVLDLAPAAQTEEARAQLRAQVSNRLAGVPELAHVRVNLLDTPAWDPTRISLAGRRILGLDAALFPILNNRPR